MDLSRGLGDVYKRQNSTWFGVTYREDKPVVQASIGQQVSSGAYPSSLWA
jgi:hypothetical protein